MTPPARTSKRCWWPCCSADRAVARVAAPVHRCVAFELEARARLPYSVVERPCPPALSQRRHDEDHPSYRPRAAHEKGDRWRPHLPAFCKILPAYRKRANGLVRRCTEQHGCPSMKFNCQQCGAKYQIADERVAGKLVRMKCRKCSEQIRVRARKMPDGSVTPHYVGDSEHVSHLPPASTMPGSLTPPPGQGVNAPPRGGTSRPGSTSAQPGSVRRGGTQLGLGVPASVSNPGGAPRRRSGLPRLGTLGRGLPRPAGLPRIPGLALPRPAGSSGLPSRPPAPKKTAARGVAAPGGAPSRPVKVPAPAVQAPPSEPDDELADEFDADATMVMARGDFESRERLAGRGVPGASAPPPSPSQELSSEPIWFVGIDEEPVGPVGADFLQKQVANGKIGASSLVWCDGMGEWEKLESISELDGVLPRAEAAPAARAFDALRPSIPAPALPGPAAGGLFGLDDDATVSAARSSEAAPEDAAATVPAPEQGAFPLPARKDATPSPLPQEAAPSSTPGRQETAPISAPAPEEAAPSSAATSSASDIEPSVAATAAPPLHDAEVAKAEAKSAAIEAQEVAPTSRELVAAGIPVERRGSKRGMHPMAWAFVAMAAAFGGVAAWFLFGQQPATQQGPLAATASATQAIPSSVATAAPEASGSSQSDPGAAASATAAATSKHVANGSGRALTAGGKASAAASSKTPKPCDPADPMCDPSVAGPSAGTNDDTDSDKGTGLSQDQLQAVVNRNRRSVSRKCLALVRSGSARVGVTIKVLPSGAVSAVSTSGGKGHPGLAGCVSSRIRNWRFPTSGASTVVNVPFTFIAQ